MIQVHDCFILMDSAVWQKIKRETIRGTINRTTKRLCNESIRQYSLNLSSEPLSLKVPMYFFDIMIACEQETITLCSKSVILF